uniref:Carboxymuconolactone decarboxylase-like domain-containing protein n=1 Tax=Candidatus Methanogaster sp. ANME-2c ERB4 TaxID=2759911 RepID=A0A7G9YHQ7_9EURY|nr:hypothetical protein GGGHDLIA_00031 [Methanosarcinales archaeon ANME-2c ERB4]
MGKQIVENISKKIGFTPDIMKTIGEIDPSFLRMYHKCDEGLLKDGALSVKVKTLMALAAVAAQRCEPRVMKRCVYLKLNRSHFCSVLVLGQKHRSR